MTVREALIEAISYRKTAYPKENWGGRWRERQIEECREAIALDLLTSFRDRMSAHKARFKAEELDDSIVFYSEAVALVGYVDELMDDKGLP